MHDHPQPTGQRVAGTRLQVADVFRRHGEAYARAHRLPAPVGRVLRDVRVCRTAALGGHLDVCDACGHSRPSYNSCRNRHCPTCQASKQLEWIEARSKRILPVHHFHVVFTLPAELRALAAFNPKVVYDRLFKSAKDTLQDLAADRLGARLGITMVLHTWTRAMLRHPHVHCVVTGGGLALDGSQWVAAGDRFLFPVAVMRALFRGKLLAAIKSDHRAGKLVVPEGVDFERLLRPLYSKHWVVFAKRPFGGARQVVAYLGRYTHRVAISSSRLLAVSDDSVTFRLRGTKTCTVHPDEFIRRFLLHVLPQSYPKIRHYGLLAPSCVNTALVRAQHLLGVNDDNQADLEQKGDDGVELDEAPLCPACRLGRLHRMPLADVTLKPWDTS